ncbi:hypothetical protein [Haladaptatus caseinilyticus]|nr:hypothetical protein [Haladaptatus caseinilyticus]
MARETTLSDVATQRTLTESANTVTDDIPETATALLSSRSLTSPESNSG